MSQLRRREGADEDERRPVVHLPHQQAGRYVEAQPHDGVVGDGHLRAVQGRVRALVDDRRLRRLEEQRQEDAGHHQYDEAVQGDLAEEERPAVREDVAQLVAKDAAAAEVGVEPARRRP
jgi:hypothetical protein